MALSTAGATLQRDIIPLLPKIDEDDYSFVTLTNVVDLPGGATEKRKVEVPKVTTEDIEYILRALKDFDTAMEAGNLDCENSPSKLYRFFRQTLSGSIRDEWDIARAGKPNTVAGFQTACDDFINRFILPTDLADQKRYLETAKKPYKMSVNALATRLRYINSLMSMFPGANDQNPYDEQGLKMLFYNMMLDDWKLNFLSSGTNITSPAFTYLMLARYMSVQESAFNAKKKARETQKSAGSRRSTGKRKRDDDTNNNRTRERVTSRRRTGGNCPFHPGSHDWDDCFGNPQGRNYRADYVLPAVQVQGGQGRNNTARQQRRGTQRRTEAHAVDNNNNGSGGSNATRNGNRGSRSNATGRGQGTASAQGTNAGVAGGNNGPEVHWLDQVSMDTNE